MHMVNVLAIASVASAFSLPSISLPSELSNIFRRKDGGNSCPSVWTSVSSELTGMYLSNGQCNDDARAAIRLVFHDCGAWNTSLGAKAGCDGSLILAGELTRAENKGLADIAGKVQNLATKYKVGVADMIVFSGAHAIVTCPGGPQLQTFIGRTDSKTPAPDGLLPDVNAPADVLFKLFQAKGYDAVGLAALLGAHSTSKQFFVDTSKAGQPQDSTPGVWDVKYYSDTTSPAAGTFVFPSDAKLAVHPTVGKEFQGFVNNQGKWNGKFADAMQQMILFGSGGNTKNMVDCTSALPKSTNIKRELKGMPINGRAV